MLTYLNSKCEKEWNNKRKTRILKRLVGMQIIFLSCSQRILKDKEDLPATRVEPADGTLFWLLDQEAGRLLNSD